MKPSQKNKKHKKRDISLSGMIKWIAAWRKRRKEEETPKKLSPGEKRALHKILAKINFRTQLLLLAGCVLAALVSAAVMYRATSKHEEYSIRAMSQLSYTSTIKPAVPGDILDANYSAIATSYRVYILILDPKVIYATENTHPGSLEAIVQLTADTFDLDKDEIYKELEENKESSYLRFNSKTIVSEEQKEVFESEQTRINASGQFEEEETDESNNGSPEEKKEQEDEDEKKTIRIQGVWFETEMRRSYPYKELASKLIGFSTIDTSEGLWGLEKSYDEELRGTNGRSITYLNDDSYLERSLSEAENGHTLVTTIDMNLQKIISDELEEWFAETDENGDLINSAKSVQILLMDPNTGAIKAYASDSDFDLNNPKDLSYAYTEEEIETFAQNTEDYNEARKTAAEEGLDFEWDSTNYPTTQNALSSMWRNSLISDSFEPGSTGKIPTFAAAIEEGVITSDSRFFCEGFLQVANTIIKCHNNHKGGCGDIDALTAVANSCNVAFINIGLSMGRTMFAHYQEAFNFGQRTGVDLPGEASCEGLIYPEEKLNDVELVTNAFGQSYNVTMLQLAAAVASTINGGYYYKPYVVSEILDSDGNSLEKKEPVLMRQTVSEETSEIVRKAMRQTVVGGNDATGYGVMVSDEREMSGYTFIAKTGTAQKLPRTANKYLISVISAVPEEHPTMLLYVAIDEYGGALQADSAPAQYLSGDIWGSIKDYIGVYSTDGTEEEITDTGADEAWASGDNPMQNLEGGLEDTPEPPEDDGSGTWSGIVIDPDSVINPEDTMPTLGE